MAKTLQTGDIRPAVSARRLRQLAVSLVFARAPTDLTSGNVSLESLGIAAEGNVPYAPSPWWILHWVLPRSKVRPDDVFVEYGCGKGRIVLAAARRYRFARVIGVELSDELSQTARALVDRERRRLRTRDVRIETVNAAEFAVPQDMTYAYVFNPVKGQVFGKMCANIIASLDAAPRTVRFLYVNPEEHDTLIATGRFQLERVVSTTRLVNRVTVAIYTVR